ncbi:zinc finger protein 436-like [Sceloporus undulatus]|uniref:zinc finger protein 436-like n=1 Tax=Sceloporus undulatus TaxID=8520 RepID=UPI001C4AEABA|nr:zinc finger protein 436-like [Sceloporus undulatus]XP_042306459.1 zinc finger protein 436-like [Sceloporus undulatus]XP_042306460.1 zinc finger protein 436-like [Sceloporus undulatus]
MATELRSGGVVNFSIQNVPQHGVNVDRNMAEEARAKTVDAEGERITPRVIQVGTIGEFLGWVAPQDLVQGSEEGLAQRWEAQWQEVLKAVQPVPIECGIQQPSKTLPWDLSGVVTDGKQWPNGEVVAQLLVDNGATFQGPDFGGNRVVAKEGATGEDPVKTEAQRRHFRQFRYLEAVGPREVCKRLRECCRRWLMPDRRTKEQILELMILEQFLTILPQEMQSWVRSHYPQVCSQAVALAEHFLREQQQQVKVLAPCEEVVVVSPETDWTPLGSGLSRPVHREAQLFNGQELRSSGSIRCPDAYALSSSKRTMNENKVDTSHHQGISELPVLLGTLSGQSDLLEISHGLEANENGTEPLEGWEEATLCSEGVYETVVRLEEHGHWCLECGESFLDALQLERHQKTQHSGRKRPECPECGKSFRDLSHVLRHQTVHTGEKPYACSECGQSFTQKPALNRHLRKHSEDKDFPGFEITIRPPRNHIGGRKRPECLECGKSFRDVSQVLRHQTVHTGERPYSCLECGQSFTQKPALNRHKRKHLEGKHYTGDEEVGVNLGNSHTAPITPQEDIASVFSNRDTLNNWPTKNEHLRPVASIAGGLKDMRRSLSRRGQKKHWCFVCMKGFRDKADLVRHERIHTGEKPYTCLECGKRFTYTSSLYKHQATHRQSNNSQRNQSKEGDCSKNILSNVEVPENGAGGTSKDRIKVKVEDCDDKSHTGPRLLSMGNLAER